MTNLVTMRVQLVAYTHFDPPTDLGWETDAEGSEAVSYTHLTLPTNREV